MFKELKRLPAGHYLTYRKGKVSIKRYWQPTAYDGPYHRSTESYMEEFGELLTASVKRRLISDVPFGAYLSGGIDSSVITALMSRMVSKPVKTFSVGFDYKHDELNDAAYTAKYLGCDHHEIPCRAEDVSLLPRIVHHMDEPMGDAIIIPMYQLSRAAKKEVTVILTGEGGDEVFGGYLFHKLMWFGDLYRKIYTGCSSPAGGFTGARWYSRRRHEHALPIPGLSGRSRKTKGPGLPPAFGSPANQPGILPLDIPV